MLLALLGASCDRDATPDAPREALPERGGTLVVALSADVDSWNPYTTHDATATGILDLLYPRLFQETDGTPAGYEPWLAESWSVSDDGLRVTFELRRDARWSDGTPVTCADVRFTRSAQLAEALAWPGAFLKTRITDVECPDPHRAVFVFSEPYADQLIDANDNAIVPASFSRVPFEEWAAASWEDAPLTCGPFRLETVRPGQEFVLARDESFWAADRTWLDRVIFRVHPDASGAVDRLLDGEADFLAKVDPLRADDIAAREDLALLDLPSLSYTFVAWNVLDPAAYADDRRRRGCDDRAAGACPETEGDLLRLQRERPHPILSDARVRRALDMAIDRADIVRGVWNGRARPGSSPIVSASWAHAAELEPLFDPAGAGRLLDEAGWGARAPDGIRERDGTRLELKVLVSAENTVRRDVLERIAAGLLPLGVRLEPEPLPRSAFVGRARGKEFDAVISGWWAGTRVQPQNLLHTRAALSRGNNLGSWSSAASDALLDRAARATTQEDAAPLWQEWQRLFARECPLTIVYEERRLAGLNRRIHGPPPPFLNPFLAARSWWVEGGSAG